MKRILQMLIVVTLIFTTLFSPAQKTVSATPSQAPSWRWYDRNAAVAYAKKWVSSTSQKRNPAWGNYTSKGGDCTNYVSQVLNAGGIPEDNAGSVQWYWDNYNPPKTSSSRSASWTGVGELYNYLVANKKGNGTKGPIADVNVAREKMEIGDVIQFDWGSNGSWDHTAVVVKAEWQGWWIFKTYKIWVAYHDTDTPSKDLDELLKLGKARYIKIWGYNAP